MADVQLERGHLRIANNLFRALGLAKLSDTQRRVLWECVGRQYGWAKVGQSPSPFVAMPSSMGRAVGCARETASRALTSLARQRLIQKVAPHTYLVVKDYDHWRCGFHGDPSEVHWTPAGDRDEAITHRDDTVTHPVIARSRGCDDTVTHPVTQVPVTTGESEALEPTTEPTRTRTPRVAPFSGYTQPRAPNCDCQGECKGTMADIVEAMLGGRYPSDRAPRRGGLSPLQKLLQIVDANPCSVLLERVDYAMDRATPGREWAYFLALFDDNGQRKPDRGRASGQVLPGLDLLSHGDRRVVRGWDGNKQKDYAAAVKAGEDPSMAVVRIGAGG